jgi:hypothetical protein
VSAAMRKRWLSDGLPELVMPGAVAGGVAAGAAAGAAGAAGAGGGGAGFT